MIDLRSDTVTRPTPGMKEAMMSAKVGDDVFGEDPTIHALEQKCAKLFGKGAAVFCPSGTMTNQIALRVLTSPFEEVICYEGSHIYMYEGGGPAGNSGLSLRLLAGDRGRVKVDDIRQSVNPDDPHFPRTSLISLENTVNKGGGSIYIENDIAAIASFARSEGISMHLDGARLMNAIVETGTDPADYGKWFDTISLCLSKGLGAPVGSVLVCTQELETKVRRARKVFGGGMRQGGYLAAAGIYALDNHVERLKEDHEKARIIGAKLVDRPWVHNVLPVDTNIIIVELRKDLKVPATLEVMKSHGLLAVAFGKRHIRLVTHLDLNDSGLEKVLGIIDRIDL